MMYSSFNAINQAFTLAVVFTGAENIVVARFFKVYQLLTYGDFQRAPYNLG